MVTQTRSTVKSTPLIKHKLTDLSVAISAYGVVSPADDAKVEFADNDAETDTVKDPGDDSDEDTPNEDDPDTRAGGVTASARLSALQFRWSSNPEFPEDSTLGKDLDSLPKWMVRLHAKRPLEWDYVMTYYKMYAHLCCWYAYQICDSSHKIMLDRAWQLHREERSKIKSSKEKAKTAGERLAQAIHDLNLCPWPKFKVILLGVGQNPLSQAVDRVFENLTMYRSNLSTAYDWSGEMVSWETRLKRTHFICDGTNVEEHLA